MGKVDNQQSGLGFSGKKTTKLRQPKKSRPSEYTIAQENEAFRLLQQGQFKAAEGLLRTLLAEGSSNPMIYGNLAAICGMTGRHDELISLLNQSIRLQPNQPDAHFNLGVAHQAKRDPKKAIESYENALHYNPTYFEALINLGDLLQQIGDFQASIKAYRSALSINKNNSNLHNNLGTALKETGEINAAIESYKSALRLDSNHQDSHYNLGNALRELGRPDDAITCYKTTLRINPSHSEAHNNLGNVLSDLGQVDMAISSYREALAIKPGNPEFKTNLGMSLLKRGDHAQGWDYYEHRFHDKNPSVFPHAAPKCPRWDGNKLSATDSILLVSEQGLGDTLQFMRYALALRMQGTSISICAQPKLHGLIIASGIDSSPRSPEEANQVSDSAWMPLLSVPGVLGVSSDNPIITDPYIRSSPESIEAWRIILSKESRPVIGINWQGNPEIEKKGYAGRSLPLENFRCLADELDVGLISLQKGFGSEQLKTCSFQDRFVSCQKLINDTWDFVEIAAIVANCDLVITSDTAVAHLAGGMGKTTWLLLKKVPEWRWGMEGDTTFWYPSMRLFRQKENGNWQEVMERVKNELKSYIS